MHVSFSYYTGTEEHQTQYHFVSYLGTVSVANPNGQIETSVSQLALGALGVGFLGNCELFTREEDGPSTEQEAEQVAAGMGALFAIGTIAGENKAVRALLLEVIQLPNWWTWLLDGFKVTIKTPFFDAERVVTPHGPGWRFPFELVINSAPAFYGCITAVEPGGVLKLTGGILSCVGFAPHHPETPIYIHFVGGHQDPEQAVITIEGAEM